MFHTRFCLFHSGYILAFLLHFPYTQNLLNTKGWKEHIRHREPGNLELCRIYLKIILSQTLYSFFGVLWPAMLLITWMFHMPTWTCGGILIWRTILSPLFWERITPHCVGSLGKCFWLGWTGLTDRVPWRTFGFSPEIDLLLYVTNQTQISSEVNDFGQIY